MIEEIAPSIPLDAPAKRSAWKTFYVKALLVLLPLLLKIGTACSKKIKRETQYLGDGFVFGIRVVGIPHLHFFRQHHNQWKHESAKSAQPEFVITFRDIDYAYDIFIGNITLQDALGARLFTTHGPNNAGVSITYLFGCILQAFFGWRRAYNK